MRHVFSTLCKTLHHLLCTFFITSEVPSSNISTLDIKKHSQTGWTSLSTQSKAFLKSASLCALLRLPSVKGIAKSVSFKKDFLCV